MGDGTAIEWTDATWNPVTGCTKVSPGCDHCYAERVTERFNGPGSFTTLQLHEDRLPQPLRWKRPRRIFVNSMSDVFHDDIPEPYLVQIFAVMAAAGHHQFQVLTKRHGRMRSLLSSTHFVERVEKTAAVHRPGIVFPWPLPNVWIGVSVEDQRWADIRIPALLRTPAAIRFLSCEPLLGPVDLSAWLDGGCTCARYVVDDSDPDRYHPSNVDREQSPGCPEHCPIDWVIVGGESGPGARPMHPEWARSLRDQCAAAGVAYLFKQWGEWAPAPDGPVARGDVCMSSNGDTYQVETGYLCAPNESDGQWLRRVGKKRAGRALDSVTHDGYPNEQY